MKQLLGIINSTGVDNWQKKNQSAFDELFGSTTGRFSDKAKKSITLRAPEFKGDSGVPFAAYIHPSNPDSGAYGGMSFVVFPVADGPAMIAMVTGTQGLSPDEEILGRPGHARKVKAICSWANQQYGNGNLIAWAKQDPVRIDQDVPDTIKKIFPEYSAVFDKYGRVIYGLFVPVKEAEQATEAVLKAFLDLMFEERGFYPLKAFISDSEKIRRDYFAHLMPDLSADAVVKILEERRFVILEGPPGTGKTRMALELLHNKYEDNGISVQFHPNTTHENFVGGLFPVHNANGIGFSFSPKIGFLMEAVKHALENPGKRYLFHIDEINRADLSKILGEAIFLFEHDVEQKRELHLSYDFGDIFRDRLSIPGNLHILGTMNSADRSIAIMDIAIRRRFAFVKLWPQMRVVQQFSCELMQKAFIDLVAIFIEYATDDSFSLVPGHSYFLEKDNHKAIQSLRINLIPLLEEYLFQGYAASFSEHIRSYMQWIETL